MGQSFKIRHFFLHFLADILSVKSSKVRSLGIDTLFYVCQYPVNALYMIVDKNVVSCDFSMFPKGVLAMFAYGGVRAMSLGLKFHLKAIFGGLKFAI